MLPPDGDGERPLHRLRAALRALLPDPTAVRWVLDAGCGAFPTVRTLEELFPAAVLLGVDHDLFALRGRPSLRLVAGDVARLPLARSVRFDLILIRHPDVDRRRQGWQRACLLLPGRLCPGGRVLVSCYTAHEVEAVREMLRAGGALPVTLAGSMPPVDLSGQDRYLLGFAGGR